MTVVRCACSTACAWRQSGADSASRSGPVASRMLSRRWMSQRVVLTSSPMTSMVPRMLRSIWTHAVVRSRTRLGSSGECGSHSGSSDQPGTRVQCRSTTAPIGPRDVEAAAGDQQSVEHDPRRVARGAVLLPRTDVEGVRPVAVPVEQPDHRPGALGGAQLEAVAGVEVEVQLLLVGAAVGDLDDAVGAAVIGSRIDGVAVRACRGAQRSTAPGASPTASSGVRSRCLSPRAACGQADPVALP